MYNILALFNRKRNSLKAVNTHLIISFWNIPHHDKSPDTAAFSGFEEDFYILVRTEVDCARVAEGTFAASGNGHKPESGQEAESGYDCARVDFY